MEENRLNLIRDSHQREVTVSPESPLPKFLGAGCSVLSALSHPSHTPCEVHGKRRNQRHRNRENALVAAELHHVMPLPLVLLLDQQQIAAHWALPGIIPKPGVDPPLQKSLAREPAQITSASAAFCLHFLLARRR